MISKIYKNIFFIITVAGIIFFITQSGCGVYRFNDVSIPDTIQIVRVNFIENKASYINPRLAPELTDKLRQKITSQTRLRQTNGDNADWDINATITGYSFSTAGISDQKVNTNRLNVSIHIEVVDKKNTKVNKYDVTRNFDYAGSKTLQQAEQELADEMLRSLTDDMFNRIFSNW